MYVKRRQGDLIVYCSLSIVIEELSNEAPFRRLSVPFERTYMQATTSNSHFLSMLSFVSTPSLT